MKSMKKELFLYEENNLSRDVLVFHRDSIGSHARGDYLLENSEVFGGQESWIMPQSVTRVLNLREGINEVG